jgi:ABC-type nitrate/sulfonate/bicarbonate transport system substrate-binding protein
MSLARVRVMYGHLEGTEEKFARDPSGYLSIETGIYRKHGLDVSWQYVQGTEERYHRLENGRAEISLLVGRASLQHFLDSRTTRILGCVMNSCPYYLVVEPSIHKLEDLKGKIVACREGPSRNTPLAEVFRARAQLDINEDLKLHLPNSDQEAFNGLVQGKVHAALLPRPYGFMAEEKGFTRMADWPGIVDDPLPITIETTEGLLRERERDFKVFLAAHREGVRYLRTHRAEAIRLLESRFAHSPSLAGKTFNDYLVCMDEQLSVDFEKFSQLLSQVAPDTPGGAPQVASEWIVAGALRE